MSRISHHPRAATGVEAHAGGSVIPAHVHDDDQIVSVSAGVLTMTTSRGVWSASPARAVLIPAGVWHEHRVHGSSRVHTLGLGSATPIATASGAGADPAVLPVTALLREVLVALSERSLEPAAAAAATGLLTALVASSPAAGVHLPRPRDARLASACAIAEADLGRNRSLPELADRVGVGGRTLSRLYRAEFGVTYPQWRSLLRVFHASIALVEGRSVTDTAAACGWATPSAFIATFARLTGQTPAAYQRSLES